MSCRKMVNWGISKSSATDVHPREKKVIGERMAAAALGKWYGIRTPYKGPTLKDWTLNKDKIYLTFDDVGEGLEVSGTILGNLTLEG